MYKPDCYRGTTNGDCGAKAIDSIMCNTCDFNTNNLTESIQSKPITSTCLVKGCKCKERERESYKMKLSVRGSQWMQFTTKVLHHIENYTVPQYGDWPDDPIEGWEAEFCALTAEKYMNRRGKAQRSGEELLDIIKAVHVLQITHDKMEVERNETNRPEC